MTQLRQQGHKERNQLARMNRKVPAAKGHLAMAPHLSTKTNLCPRKGSHVGLAGNQKGDQLTAVVAVAVAVGTIRQRVPLGFKLKLRLR